MSKYDGFDDRQARTLERELARLREALVELQAGRRNVIDRRQAGTFRARAGDVVRTQAGQTVILPHPKPSKGQTVTTLIEGSPLTMLAESGTVNNEESARVQTLGAIEWTSTGTEWWGTAAGGPTGGGGVDDLSIQHDVTLAAGTYEPYLLPSGFRNRDTLSMTITGDVIIRSVRFSDGSVPDDGFIMYLALRDQSGGAAPGWSVTIEDAGAGFTDGRFRTPGQVQGTSPGPSYVMQSEEEGATLVMATGNWRIVGGTAGQAITGDITVAAGNGSTRTAEITAGAIVNADVNANAAIAVSKLASGTACSVLGRSANSAGAMANIQGATNDRLFARVSNALSFTQLTAGMVPSALVTPAMLAVLASSVGPLVTIYASYTAGGGGAADDVTIFSANAPFALRILDVVALTATAVGGSTVELRSATGGGGSALSSALSSAATGTARNNDTATRTVAANGTVVLRRSDNGVAGEVIIFAVKT